MRKFIVLSNNITGVNGRCYVQGQEICESQLRPGVADIYISRGRIKEISVQRVIPEGEKIKLAIVTSIWKRHDIFELFAKGVKNLMEKCDQFEITVVVSGSEWIKSHDLVRVLHGFNYIEIPNEPLAAKVNATTYACKDLGVDYVLCVGSDDVISPELLNEYAIHMRKGIDFIGITDCYFYDTVSKKSLYWGGYREQYRKGHTTGAFRALSVRLLAQWDWMPWENKDSLVLDKSMQDKLKVTPHTIHTFSMKEKGMFALDIKSSTNMTPFAKWDNADFIDTKELLKQFEYLGLCVEFQ